MKQELQTITLAVTGASGIPYALRLLECLLAADKTVYFIMSQAAQVVSAMESDLKLPSKVDDLQAFLEQNYANASGTLKVYGHQQWSAPVASGSAAADAMVVCPCSSGALSAIACGASNNLLERAADVMLKESKPLILVHRETPLSLIHIENMATLTRAGATIMPANPGFYYKPEKVDDLVDFMVARILDHLAIPQSLLPRWGAEN